MHGPRRKEPVFQFLDEFLFLLGFLDSGEPSKVRVRREFGRRRTMRAEKQKGQFLQAIAALGGEQAGPPVGGGKILSGERKFFEIILEQEPGALRIGAHGEGTEKFLASGNGGL